jgi:hypothetical protein
MGGAANWMGSLANLLYFFQHTPGPNNFYTTKVSHLLSNIPSGSAALKEFYYVSYRLGALIQTLK